MSVEQAYSGKIMAREQMPLPEIKDGFGFVLAVFDSTYSRSGITSYIEGITFASHILQLTEEYPDIYVFLKEKTAMPTNLWTLQMDIYFLNFITRWLNIQE